MLWLTYDVSITFKHNLKEESWVVDDSCLVPHEHTSEFEFRIQALPNEKIDFKKIKEIINAIMNQYIHINITEIYGINSTEDFACKIVGEIEEALFTLGGKRKVQLHIQETAKYGVTVE